MQKQFRRSLMLNVDYQPLGIINWKRAMVLYVVSEDNYVMDHYPELGAQVIEFYNDQHITCSGGRQWKIPAVLRKLVYVKRKKKIPFNRKNVFIRDDCKCRYCGEQFLPNELTYDHVIPRSVWKKKKMKGSPTTWTNIVTCCMTCNHKKGDKTLDKAGFKLHKPPQEPSHHKYLPGFAPWHKVPDEWIQYLPNYKDLINASFHKAK